MEIDLLRRLCETPGIPGREERVRDLIASEIDGLFDEVRTDPMGSLICTRSPTSKSRRAPARVMIAAHMDEIGFYVRHVDEHGFLWVNPAGGFDTRNLFSRRVLVCTSSGDFEGVMNPGGKPLHIATAEERKKVPEVEEFFIDLGLPARTAQRKVRVGDFVVMHEPFMEQPQKVVSKALDNRVACFIAIEAVRKIARSRATASRHSCELVVVFTVQEEVGLRGAITAANSVGADIGIGLDTTLAVDTPGVSETQRVTKHGDGVGIMIQDSSMIADHALVDDLCTLATKKKIPHQRCILPRGGQDGAAIQRSGPGARTAAVVCGTRYIHTVTESIDRKDLQAAIDLLAAWAPTVK
ncbi:MAG: M42 family metallopeptidase [Planctomycetes bacterium]|nr:M42 family metallopeptidase [Planctomycetota bacterium]